MAGGGLKNSVAFLPTHFSVVAGDYPGGKNHETKTFRSYDVFIVACIGWRRTHCLEIKNCVSVKI